MRLVMGVVLLLLPLSAHATPFGLSYDGTPPGTVAQILGIDAAAWTAGTPAFTAGQYTVHLTNGVTAWADQDIVKTSDGSTIHEDIPNTFTSMQAWTLEAWTPHLMGASSTGNQWAWTRVSDTAWLCGLEDMLSNSDYDYNDKLCMVTFLAPLPECTVCTPTVIIPTPTPIPPIVTPLEPETPLPVPEPHTLLLVGAGLLLLGRLVRKGPHV